MKFHLLKKKTQEGVVTVYSQRDLYGKIPHTPELNVGKQDSDAKRNTHDLEFHSPDSRKNRKAN